MRNIDSVVFDLDDTVILENDFIESAFNEISHYINQNYQLDQSSVYKELLNLHRENVKNVFDRFLQQHNFPPEIVNVMIKIYKNHSPNLAIIPDVRPVLDKLKNYGKKLAVITDGDVGTQKRKLQAIKAETFFDVIIVTDEYGIQNRKPAAFPYVKCLHELGVNDFTKAVYVGDNVAKDFITAKRLGMLTVQIERKEGLYKQLDLSKEYHAHYKIESMPQLLPLIGVI
jgi:putative hydrolase of the HAD superfamily